MHHNKPSIVFVALLMATLAIAGVACCAPPVTFEVTNLVITPTEVGVGEEATVTANVTNTGEVDGTKAISLKIDGVVEDSEDVTLAAGANQTVTFTVTKDAAGTYEIEVDGQTGNLTVTGADVTPTPEVTPTPAATPPATPEGTPTPVTYATWTDEENGYAIDYPEHWAWDDQKVAETENCLAAFKSPTAEDGFYPYLYVTATPDVPYPVSMVLMLAPWADTYPGYSRVSHEDTTVEGVDAIIVVFTCDEGKAKQLLVVKENTLWAVTCLTTEGTFDVYESIFDLIIAGYFWI